MHRQGRLHLRLLDTSASACINELCSTTDMGMELPSRESPSEQVRGLMLRKSSIEAEIDAQASILKANNVTMQSPLIDPEGFPRADIDVWEVRHARVRIIELRNDLKDVMDLIMKGLQGVYDPTLVVDAPKGGASNLSELHPFAQVNGVAPGSPAASAVSQPLACAISVILLSYLNVGPSERRFNIIIWKFNAFCVHF